MSDKELLFLLLNILYQQHLTGVCYVNVKLLHQKK